MKQTIKNILILLVFCGLLYLNLSKLQSTTLGILLLFIYLSYTSKFVKTALVKFFYFSSDSIRVRILSAFFVIFVFSSITGAIVLLYKLTTLVLVFDFFFVGLLLYVLHHWALKSRNDEKEINYSKVKEKISLQMPKAKVGVLIYVILWFVSLVFLIGSRKDGNFLSPWQVINEWYIVIFFILTVIVGLLIFSKLKTKFILFLLILHTFLLHSYLPLTNSLIYGTDQWRHMAVERQIVSGQSINIVLNDEKPVNFVQALNPGKLAYAQLWATESVVAKTTSINLIKVNKWLVVLLFSLLLPILLYEIGLSLKFGPRKRLLLVWLSFLFFPLQSLGSVTLPVSFGFLSFLAMILLILKRVKKKRGEQLIILFLLFFLSLFGYSLYVILLGMFWLVIEMMSKRKKEGRKFLNFLKVFCLTVFFAISIPLIELVTKYSVYSSKIVLMDQIKQFVGNVLGVYIASGPRTHDILGGNIFFNQTPIYAFVSNVFTDLRTVIPVLSIGFFLVILIGFVICLKRKELHWLAITGFALFLSYFIGFYILSGQRLLSRRLDLTISFVLLLLLTMGLYKLLVENKKNASLKTVVTLIIISFAITLSYSLGPDTKTVSSNQFKAMEYIYEETNNDNTFCVISDTYSLLALEYHSSKKIVGGGFPMDKDFNQDIRTKVLKKIEDGSASFEDNIFLITKSKRCFIVLKSTELNKARDSVARRGSLKNIFGNVEVWEYN